MRVSRDVAAKNRERVVETAGKEFRAHGYDGIGVAGLMKAAGLTHGGFYKQFEDKEALAVESTRQALEENLEHWRKVIEAAPDDPVATLMRWYLSPEHVERVRDGCAYAALAGEAPRHEGALRDVFEQALEKSIGLLAGADGADDDPDSRERERSRAMRAIAMMVGSLVLARAVSDSALAAELLDAGRESEA